MAGTSSSLADAGDYPVVFLGDSITHGWEGEGREVWQRRFLGYRVLDIGFSGDRVQNQLWNAAYGGLLDGYRTGLMMLLVGTNNAKDILYDFTHPTAKGYGIWADAILPYLEKYARR